MSLRIDAVDARGILTRTSGYLRSVCSHSLQPYRGCSYGRSLCGVSCYVQHNRFLTRGEAWGSFLEPKQNAAALYLEQAPRERRYAEKRAARFSIFMSSATDPFVPQERKLGISRRLLEAMLDAPPDELILQTHSDRVRDYAELIAQLARRCSLRVHISVESDRESLPGLPPPAASVGARLAAAGALRRQGIRVVATVAPLLPIAEPERFFRQLGECFDAIVIDHYIGGDGSRGGARTARTALPDAIAAVDPSAVALEYRDRMIDLARTVVPDGIAIGVGQDGFAGRMLR